MNLQGYPPEVMASDDIVDDMASDWLTATSRKILSQSYPVKHT